MRPKIMYIENKADSLNGRGRIGLVSFSKTGKSLYYGGKAFQSLKGGYKANYFEVESGDRYWISGPKRWAEIGSMERQVSTSMKMSGKSIGGYPETARANSRINCLTQEPIWFSRSSSRVAVDRPGVACSLCAQRIIGRFCQMKRFSAQHEILMASMTMLSLVAALLLSSTSSPVAKDLVTPLDRQLTYCNPINVDYGYTPIPDFATQGRHRATADPVVVLFRGDYYLFSTNQWGYWWSHDMVSWHFVARHFLRPEHKVYDDLCAPAVWVMNDKLYVIGSTYAANFPIWVSDNPKVDDWREAIHEFKPGGWDPAWFVDDDGRLYMYHGSSNVYPIYGQEIDPKTFEPIGPHPELIHLHDDEHGWERFGEANDNSFLRPFMEGAWMTKHGGKYYLQYGAPGTEFSGYGDGVYVSDHPLGPFEYQAHNPLSYKPGGFVRGAGHGATFQDRDGLWWHVSTITIAVKNSFERRVGIWPAGFDRDGIMYTDTTFGDYPTYLPHRTPSDTAEAGAFTGWMLLNYNKPVTVSSTLGGYAANNAVDESIRTYWSAKTGDPGEWIQSDLGEVSTVRAVQINYADQDAEFLGKQLGTFHQYRLYASRDGHKWDLIADKSRNKTDVPHDYIELAHPIEVRYVKLENVHMPTGKFAISGLRVFGQGHGAKPLPVQNFVPLRADRVPGKEYNGAMADRRNAWLKWKPADDATGYIIRCGIAPDKLYTSVIVYGANEYYFRAMDKSRTYYFQIQAFNENGLSAPTAPVKSD